MKTKTIVFSLAIGLSLATSATAGDHGASAAAEYFSQQPSTFNAYVYRPSMRLTSSGPQRLIGQIISSHAAAPMQVDIITVDERIGSSGAIETVSVVEAKPLFVPPGGLSFVTVTVTGIPAPSKTSSM